MSPVRARLITIGILAVSALGTFSALATVLVPAPVDARLTATRALAAARGSGGAIADDVAPRLPEGARAVVLVPGPGATRAGTQQVAVLSGDVDQAAAVLLVSSGGVVASDASTDGWWVAVSVPAPEPPFGAAFGLLVCAVLLGAIAAEVPRRRW
ncbi:hypothetical protein [Actinosynnema sp. NPDC020468]|uniref:hypothetical protein n=1 Tax=Actinosynnema sp. NPDC020468 TaxID=3154488 RepID=UPI0033EFC021